MNSKLNGNLVRFLAMAATASSIAGYGCTSNTDKSTGGSSGAAWFGGTKSDPMMSSNIVAVRKFFSNSPWLIFDTGGSGRVDGVKMTVYLEAADRAKGVFGTGTLIVTMYQINRDEKTGEQVAEKVYEWELPPDRAYTWRAKQESVFGWGYGLRLNWGKQLDVAGREIAFIVRYIREDGGQVKSSRQILTVPNVGAMSPGPRNLS